MDVVYECCAGLDVHKRTVVACVLRSGPGGVVVKKTQTFSTMTTHLAALADWLAGEGCTHVALEATGVYWKPVYNLLEERFTVLVVNPEHIKATSVHYPDREHGLLDDHGPGHGSGPSAVWAQLAAPRDHY